MHESDPSVDHVLLTRFNLPSAGVESLIRAQESWLRDRVGLFERYCLTSVAAQTDPDFAWIIYFDEESPTWLREWIPRAQQAFGFHALYRTEVTPQGLVEDLRAVVPVPRTHLLTTNLDNDDALAVDAVARLRQVAPASDRRAVYLTHGVIASDHRTYARTDRHNAFCSVLEPWEHPETCWVDWHTLLPQRMPVVELAGPPGWLQVVHGTNVSNRVHGRLTDPRRFDHLFPGLLDDVLPPPLAERLRDRLVAQPLRWGRDGGRAVAKAAVLRLVGKDGLDRWKGRLAAVRRRG